MKSLNNLTQEQLIDIARNLIRFNEFSIYDSQSIESETAIYLALEQQCVVLELDLLEGDQSVIIGTLVNRIINAVKNATQEQLSSINVVKWEYLVPLLPSTSED